MFASFRVVTNAGTQSLAVPTTAIVREGDKTSVWVAQGQNHFARRDVTTGIQQGGYVQIVSGLQLGETVVSEGSLFVGNAAKS
jgi:cobalt-zinc-cadmium efflux system membrane fusion protein